MEFNQAQYGPYPARTSTERITDENAPVKILVPGHPVFNVAQQAQRRATGRGGCRNAARTSSASRSTPKYVDLIEMEDPFEFNKGPKRGALVEARYGKGRWLYVGLGLWRQLPSGTDGAYRLFANLISLGQAAGEDRSRSRSRSSASPDGEAFLAQQGSVTRSELDSPLARVRHGVATVGAVAAAGVGADGELDALPQAVAADTTDAGPSSRAADLSRV